MAAAEPSPDPDEGARSPEQADRLPRSFGRYVLFDRIGRGGMADIYLARAKTGLGGARLAVVKQVLPLYSGSDEFSQLLSAEAKLAARLSHANVVQVFDLGREGDRLYIAMEYVEGYDLHQLLRRLTQARVPLPAEFAIFIITEALRALDYAHRARDEDGNPLGVVHRDVSPSNVLISFEGEVKLCDFGIARAAADLSEVPDDSVVRRTRIAGKSAYMAPEQARGESYDERADVFCAGILLWELCAGRRMYRGTDEEKLAQAQRGEVPELPDRGLPEQDELQRILGHALAPEPDERYPSAGQMLRDLEQYVARTRLVASPLRFGQFLTAQLGGDIVGVRRARERAAAALEKGPPVVMTPVQGQQRDEAGSQSSGSQGSAGRSPSKAYGEQGSNGWLYLLLGVSIALTVLVVYFGLQ
jgi:serine/threonine-protein kinase